MTMEIEKDFVFDENFDQSLEEIIMTDFSGSHFQTQVTAQYERKATASSSDDDDDDEDDDDGDYYSTFNDSKNISYGLDDNSLDSSSQRKKPSVREHSKAQREKRKTIQRQLEEKAKILTEELAKRTQSRADRFESLRLLHSKYKKLSELFLRMWYSPPNLHYSGEIVSVDKPLHWSSVVDPFILVTTPVCVTQFGPPIVEENQRITLCGVAQLTSYIAGHTLMCQSVARLGSNVTRTLILTVTLKNDSFVVDGDKCVASYVVMSKNAVLCGGSYEINFGGACCLTVCMYLCTLICWY